MTPTPAQLAAYARTRTPDEPYDYFDPQRCALHQYLGSVGAPVSRVRGSTWIDTDQRHHRIPDGMRDALYRGDSTWGALAGRLEALQ